MAIIDPLLYPEEVPFNPIGTRSGRNSSVTCWMRYDPHSTSHFLQSTDPNLVVTSAASSTAGVINVLQSILGITLNAFVIWIILTRRSVRKEYLAPSLLSISITDFVFSAYSIPISASLYLNREHPLSSQGCSVYAIIAFGIYYCSALNLLGISFLRTILVYKKAKGKKFRYLCIMTPVIGWIVPMLWFLPSFVGKWGQFGLECKSLWCQWVPYNFDQNRVNTTYTPATLGYPQLFICGLVILGMNLATFFKIRKDISKVTEGFKDEAGQRKSLGMSKKMIEKERKAGKMVALIVSAFFLVYFPLNMLFMIHPFALITHPTLALFFYVFTCNLGIIDPLLYILWHQKFRKEIRRQLAESKMFPLAHRLASKFKDSDDCTLNSLHSTKPTLNTTRTNHHQSTHETKVPTLLTLSKS